MDEKELENLISIFEKSSLQVMEIEKNQDLLKVRLEKSDAAKNPPIERFSYEQEQGNENKTTDCCQNDHKGSVDSDKDGVEIVKSPIVGVFYEAASPEEPPFVRLGETVEKGQTLCLVEAMKMMNELKSPVNGVVRRILAENGALVEYGQILYEVVPC